MTICAWRQESHNMINCVICSSEYERPRKSERRTCSKSCAVALSWQAPGVKERRSESILEAKASPRGKVNHANANRVRWADPLQHEILTAKNVKNWRDENFRERTIQAIKAAWTPEVRKRLSDKKRSHPRFAR